MDECVFCKRIEDGQFDFYNAEAVSFRPLNPVVPGHRLFLPRMHVRNAAEKPYITGKTFELAATYAQLSGGEFNLITSSGIAATQSVFHLHVHYVPRRSGDGLMLPWTNQKKAETND